MSGSWRSEEEIFAEEAAERLGLTIDCPPDEPVTGMRIMMAMEAEIAHLRLAIRRLAEQDATLSVCDGNVTVTMDATLTDAKRRIANMSGEWIPVAERLPEKGVAVIGWFPGATQSFECSLNEHDGVWCDYGTGIYLYENERPTHWMPFPDGPTDAK